MEICGAKFGRDRIKMRRTLKVEVKQWEYSDFPGDSQHLQHRSEVKIGR
jgi:hypothetical protein